LEISSWYHVFVSFDGKPDFDGAGETFFHCDVAKVSDARPKRYRQQATAAVDVSLFNSKIVPD
jgi:hypothetical protein